ncbi:alpha/beta hydrolase [Bacillus mycoides]|uniref:alpha/beta hydrolase n=1 Tax=Bacillus mycoides TaxID=1405 RepID=UPI001C02E02B|nr:alpha/beta hydrolase [Bacillus mycoides]QWG64739.1 alpha/beta hydrolase [Bacillus mycoides]QWG93113.1 alpha/beta hydrolase [Bacillus mycoides]QWJ09184.1 alpha/beta hydrolase [Bacillus mycoides]
MSKFERLFSVILNFLHQNLNYRLATPSYSTCPGIMDDMRLAIDYIVNQSYEWNLNPQNIGVMGDSAGGYLAAMLVLKYVQ